MLAPIMQFYFYRIDRNKLVAIWSRAHAFFVTPRVAESLIIFIKGLIKNQVH
jgi:hypothetical protein